jgi:IS5 family transposase
MLIGYIENINSDRKIVETAQMRLDMLYFLGYDIDEPLPWHSTLSRPRTLFGESVFLELFRSILILCVSKGMVSGRTQAIDSAFIKANASLDSMVERELHEKSQLFFNALTENEEAIIPSKEKYNDSYVSATDPDARVSQKQGKTPLLNHLGIISVDTEHHVICGAKVDFADKHDSATTRAIVEHAMGNLQQASLRIEEVLADTGYSSGESYRYLEENNITAFIPPISGYKPVRNGFVYNKEADCYVCAQGKKKYFRGIEQDRKLNTRKKIYKTSVADCKNCPLLNECCKNMKYKRLRDSVDKPYYDKAYQLLNTRTGKQKIRLRGATVEPVWGTLLHFRRMKKVYTLGNELANTSTSLSNHKQLLMAAATYNLMKFMRFTNLNSAAKTARSMAAELKSKFLDDFLFIYQ